jgi:hypothetical protein
MTYYSPFGSFDYIKKFSQLLHLRKRASEMLVVVNKITLG